MRNAKDCPGNRRRWTGYVLSVGAVLAVTSCGVSKKSGDDDTGGTGGKGGAGVGGANGGSGNGGKGGKGGSAGKAASAGSGDSGGSTGSGATGGSTGSGATGGSTGSGATGGTNASGGFGPIAGRPSLECLSYYACCEAGVITVLNRPNCQESELTCPSGCLDEGQCTSGQTTTGFQAELCVPGGAGGQAGAGGEGGST